jgi:hypothetical protein
MTSPVSYFFSEHALRWDTMQNMLLLISPDAIEIRTVNYVENLQILDEWAPYANASAAMMNVNQKSTGLCRIKGYSYPDVGETSNASSLPVAY